MKIIWARLAVVSVVLLAAACLAGCRSDASSSSYCGLMTDASGEIGLVSAGGRGVLEQRRAAAPAEIEEEWSTVLAGRAMESDGPDGPRKEAAYNAAVATIEAYNTGHCTSRDGGTG